MNTANEQAIIGILLQDPNAYFATDKINLDMFKDTMNYHIYEAMTALNLKSLIADIPTLVSQLNASGHNNYANHLMELKENATSSSNLSFYVDKLIESDLKRVVSKHTLDLHSQLHDDNLNVADSLTSHIIEVSKLLPLGECRADASSTIDRFNRNREVMKLELASGSQLIGVPTGIKAFDTLSRGLRKSSMTTIGALSGSYKTYFALNIATNYAKQGKSILYFSLEMADIELFERIIPMVKPAGNTISYSDTVSPDLNPLKLQHLEEAMAEYKKLNFIIDWGTRNIDKILAYAEKIKRSKQGLDLIVIDHIQLLERSGDPATLTEYTGRLKNYAMTNNIPVIIVSQFNRTDQSKSAGTKPKRSWLRGSSSIEQDSDAIIFLHREDPNLPETTLILDKFRQASFSKTLEIPLLFDEHTCILKETIKTHFPKPQYKKDKYTQQVHDYTTGF